MAPCIDRLLATTACTMQVDWILVAHGFFFIAASTDDMECKYFCTCPLTRDELINLIIPKYTLCRNSFPGYLASGRFRAMHQTACIKRCKIQFNTTNGVIKIMATLWVLCPIARFIGPIWGPYGAYRTQVGPMLAPWNQNQNQKSFIW